MSNYFTEIREKILAVMDTADATGCEQPLTVVDENKLMELHALGKELEKAGTMYGEIIQLMQEINGSFSPPFGALLGEPTPTEEEVAQAVRVIVGDKRPTLMWDLHNVDWQAVGPEDNPDLMQKAVMTINGVDFHIEADAVIMDDGVQTGLCDTPGYPSWVDSGVAGNGPFETIKIGSLPFEYAVLITPFSK